MNCEIQDAAIHELTQQELENVSGGTGVVGSVVGAVKEVAKDVVIILSTGTIDTTGTDLKRGVNAGAQG